MSQFIQINNRYIPLYAIASIDDDGGEVEIAIRDPRHGPDTIRISGDAANQLRQWLSNSTAVKVQTEMELQDNGARMDD